MRSALRVVLVAGVVFLAVVPFWPVAAQQGGEPTKAPAAEGSAADGSAKEPKGRLPRFYDVVVTPEQRKRIYEIQDKYEARIQALLQQIEQLKKQRDREIEAVLDDEQRDIIARLRALAERQKAQAKKKATQTP